MSYTIPPETNAKRVVFLRKIARCLSISDLKSFRLVCREWNYASLKIWRSNAVLRVLFANLGSEEECRFRNEVQSKVWAMIWASLGIQIKIEPGDDLVDIFANTMKGSYYSYFCYQTDKTTNGISFYELYKLYHESKRNLFLNKFPYKAYKIIEYTSYVPFGHEFLGYSGPCTLEGLFPSLLKIGRKNMYDDVNWFLREILRRHAHSLELDHCMFFIFDDQFPPVLRSFKKLQNLKLTRTGFINPEESWSACHQLADLFSIPESVNSCLQSLRTLSFEYMMELDHSLRGTGLKRLLNWASILDTMPNLENFIMKNWNTEHAHKLLIEMLEGMRDVRRTNPHKLNLKLLNIKDLSLGWTGEPLDLFLKALVDLLIELKFPLKTLIMNIDNFRDRHGLIPRLLKTFRRTLEALYLERAMPGPYPSYLEMYPFGRNCEMKYLKVLQFRGIFSRNVAFLKLFPNLEVLTTSYHNVSAFHNNCLVMRNDQPLRLERQYVYANTVELRQLTGVNYSVQTVIRNKLIHFVVTSPERKFDWKDKLIFSIDTMKDFEHPVRTQIIDPIQQ